MAVNGSKNIFLERCKLNGMTLRSVKLKAIKAQSLFLRNVLRIKTW